MDKPHYHGHRQRLRERLLRDPRQVADYEILELLMGYVMLRQDTKPLAKAMLDKFGSIRAVFEASEEELTALEGFGPGLATFWALWREAWARLHESGVPLRTVLSQPSDVAAMAMARLGASRTEEFWLALVDAKNRLLAWERLSSGTVDQTAVYPREMLTLALKHKAYGVILVHNHPGGDPRPSAADVEMTRRLVRAGLEVGVKVLDHVIVAGRESYSFQAHGLL